MPQQRRLAAAGGPDEDHELAVLDPERDVVDGRDVAGEGLRHAARATISATTPPPARGRRAALCGSRARCRARRGRPRRPAGARRGRAVRRHAPAPRSQRRPRPRARRRAPCRFRTASIIVTTLPASTPSVAPRDAVPDLDVDAAQAVAAVTDPGGRDRVRDERNPSGLPPARRLSPSLRRGGGRRGSSGRSRRRGRAQRRRCPGRGGRAAASR